MFVVLVQHFVYCTICKDGTSSLKETTGFVKSIVSHNPYGALTFSNTAQYCYDVQVIFFFQITIKMRGRVQKNLSAAPGLFPDLSVLCTFPPFRWWNGDAVADLICKML